MNTYVLTFELVTFILLPVTIQTQSTYQVDMKCKDKLLIQSKIVPLWTNQEDVTPAMVKPLFKTSNSFIFLYLISINFFQFWEDGISYVEENMLWVVPVSRAHSPILKLTTDIELLKELLKNLKVSFFNLGIRNVVFNVCRFNKYEVYYSSYLIFQRICSRQNVVRKRHAQLFKWMWILEYFWSDLQYSVRMSRSIYFQYIYTWYHRFLQCWCLISDMLHAFDFNLVPILLLFLQDRQGASIYQSKSSSIWNCLFLPIIISVIGFGLLILFEWVLYPFPHHHQWRMQSVWELWNKEYGTWMSYILKFRFPHLFMYSGLSVCQL